MRDTPAVLPRPIRYATVVACALVLLYASVVDPGRNAPPPAVGGTATLHVVSYGVLAWLVGYAALATDRRTLLVAFAVATTYGAAIELLQGFVPHRTASILDVLLNAAGATLGAWLWRRVGPRFGAAPSSRTT